MRLTESEKNRILSLHNTEKNKFILSEKRFKLGKVTINKNKDGYYSLILNSKKWGFDPEKLKDTDKVFELIKTSLSDEHPNLTSDRVLFREKIDKFGGRDVHRFAILPQIAVTKSEEDEIKTDLEQDVEQSGSQTILNQEILTIISNFQDKLDGTVPSTMSLTTSTDTETVQKANKTECPLDPNGPILRKGKRGERVKILQLMLMDCGSKLDKFGPDGKFGQETYDAVEKYQIDNNLGVDGKAGPETIGSLCQCSTTKGVDVWQDEKYDNLKDELEQSSTGSRGITNPDWPSEYGCVFKIDGAKNDINPNIVHAGDNDGNKQGQWLFYDTGVYYHLMDLTLEGRYECWGDVIKFDKGGPFAKVYKDGINYFTDNKFEEALRMLGPMLEVDSGYYDVAVLVFMSIVGKFSSNITSRDKKLAKKALKALEEYHETTPLGFLEIAEILYDVEINRERLSASKLDKLRKLSNKFKERNSSGGLHGGIACAIEDLVMDYSLENYDGPLIVGC